MKFITLFTLARSRCNGTITILVGTTRFELATTRPPAWYATGLRYVPNLTVEKYLIQCHYLLKIL
jgi:hypothetical protein